LREDLQGEHCLHLYSTRQAATIALQHPAKLAASGSSEQLRISCTS